MSSLARPILASALLCIVGAASNAGEAEKDGPSSTVSVFSAESFARSRIYSAFEILALLPGYTFVERDVEVRGYANATGNVLIDGSRPASKYESLEAVLRRIPVSAVERIELIRAGTPGVDMQGYAVLANVVRADRARTRGSVELEGSFYEADMSAPRLAGELSHRSGDRLIEVSASFHEEIEDEFGAGRRTRRSGEGEVVHDGSYVHTEIEEIAQVAAGYEDTALGGRLRLHGSVQQSVGRASIVEALSLPLGQSSKGRERGKERGSEIGIRFERAFEPVEMELLAIRRDARARSNELSISGAASSLFQDDSKATESIVRAALRHERAARVLKGGLELAINTLDSHSRLTGNDVVVSIPSSDITVEEQRAEAFLTSQWTLGGPWRLELGARLELSRLEQSEAGASSKSFFFPKPRAQLTWARGRDQVRLLLEREVGQLDFEDFASSASLSTGTVTAGNPDLEPDRTWRADLAWERRFLDTGALSVAVRHERIEHLVDRIPIVADTVFDSVGNIDSGTRRELEIDLTLPLDSLGVSAGVLKASALWRHSRATDPMTRESRPISEDEPFEASLHLQQALPKWKARWGVELTLAEMARQYFFDEARAEREGAVLDVFVEIMPAPAWSVRLLVGNLTDRESVQRRTVHEGGRDGSRPDYIDTRTLVLGRHAGILVRRSFGN